MNRRRALAAVLAAGAAPWARASPAQRVIGYLSNGAGKEILGKPLAEHGYVEGRNLRIEMRFARNGDQELDAAARELVAMQPDVLVAYRASNVNALARHTTTIPIVCGGTADPVGIGYAKTLRRPGGNITGLSYGLPEMAEVIVGLMGSVRPGLRRIVTIVDGARPDAVGGWTPILRSVEAAARQAGLDWAVVAVDSMAQVEQALGKLDAATSIAYVLRIPASVKGPELAAAFVRRRMVSSTSYSYLVREGLLMQYAIEHADPQRRVAGIVDALLRGAKAAETPFQLPDRTIFMLNRRTAQEIGIELSAALLTRATEIVG